MWTDGKSSAVFKSAAVLRVFSMRLFVEQDKALKVLHDHRGQCHRSVVIQASYGSVFGDGNDGGCFQGSVEDPC